MMSAFAIIYADLIRKDLKKLEDVKPESLKEEVRQLLGDDWKEEK